MWVAIILLTSLLTACTAQISSTAPEAAEVVRDLVFLQPAIQVPLSASGSLFVGKFATSGALNSNRSYAADYHGEVRLTFFEDRRIQCHFWADGRITDPTVFDGENGFVSAVSTVCAGKLQRDGSFEFQAAYTLDAPEELLYEDEEHTATIRGQLGEEVTDGELELGTVFGRAPSLEQATTVQAAEKGVAFEAVVLSY